MTSIERFHRRYRIDPKTGCWIWSFHQTKTGYGKFWADGKMWMSHRFAYETFKGEIPERMEIHHKCRNRSCVNPEHLEPITHQENCATDFKKTHCPNGHEFVEGSYYVVKNGAGTASKACKQCAKERAKAWHSAHRDYANRRNNAYYHANQEAIKAANRARYHAKKAAPAD